MGIYFCSVDDIAISIPIYRKHYNAILSFNYGPPDMNRPPLVLQAKTEGCKDSKPAGIQPELIIQAPLQRRAVRNG